MADYSDIPLASLALTHVFYDPTDPVSHLCAWLALVPQALCVVYVTLIWSTREAEVVLMFAGQLACEAANLALKRLIKEQRPPRIRRAAGAAGAGYGMPSSHAQFVAFWAVATALFLLARHAPLPLPPPPARPLQQAQQQQQQQQQQPQQPQQQPQQPQQQPQQPQQQPKEEQEQEQERSNGSSSSSSSSSSHRRGRQEEERAYAEWAAAAAAAAEAYARRPWSRAERGAASALVLAVAAAVAWSRVYLGYHTPRQVLAGALAGAACAGAWFAATRAVRRDRRGGALLARALAAPPARALRLRDLAVCEDLAQAGWEKWVLREAAAAALAEASSRKKK